MIVALCGAPEDVSDPGPWMLKGECGRVPICLVLEVNYPDPPNNSK